MATAGAGALIRLPLCDLKLGKNPLNAGSDFLGFGQRQSEALRAQPITVDPDDLVQASRRSVASSMETTCIAIRIIGNPRTTVNARRNAALIAARGNASARKGSRDRRRDTACLKSENVSGSARTPSSPSATRRRTAATASISVAMSPAGRIATPFTHRPEAHRSHPEDWALGRPGKRGMRVALSDGASSIALLDPHFDLPASREVASPIEEALGGTESGTVPAAPPRRPRQSSGRRHKRRRNPGHECESGAGGRRPSP